MNNTLLQKKNRRSTVKAQSVLRFLVALLFAFLIAGIIAALFGYNPFEMYVNLFKGAWVGKLNFGTTLEKLPTMLLLGMAFNLGSKVGFFNLGLEGSLYLGALTYAVIGYQFPGLPGYIYIPLCVITSMIVGAVWAFIPAFLRARWNVNELCVTLLLNYVVTNFCTYSIYYVWSAKTSIPQTPELAPQVQFAKILMPSRANVGLFIALIVFFVVLFVIYKTPVGYRLKAVGQNEMFAEYIGIDQKRTMIITVMVGGAIAALAGGMEVAGLYGRFVDEFASGATFNGLLASRLVSHNLLLLPFSAFALATLQAGAYGVERACGISRAFIDCFTAIIIMMVTIDGFYDVAHNGAVKIRNLFSRKAKREEAQR